MNNDGVINVADRGLMRVVFFTSDANANANANADLNGDGLVNVTDLGILRASFFGAPGPSGVAP
ncbi:MAG: dockerin type I domain-containing protein [Gammaproteobacteria bacterium]